MDRLLADAIGLAAELHIPFIGNTETSCPPKKLPVGDIARAETMIGLRTLGRSRDAQYAVAAGSPPVPGRIGIGEKPHIHTPVKAVTPSLYYARLYPRLYGGPVKRSNTNALLKAFRNVENAPHELPVRVPPLVNTTGPVIITFGKGLTTSDVPGYTTSPAVISSAQSTSPDPAISSQPYRELSSATEFQSTSAAIPKTTSELPTSILDPRNLADEADRRVGKCHYKIVPIEEFMAKIRGVPVEQLSSPKPDSKKVFQPRIVHQEWIGAAGNKQGVRGQDYYSFPQYEVQKRKKRLDEDDGYYWQVGTKAAAETQTKLSSVELSGQKEESLVALPSYKLIAPFEPTTKGIAAKLKAQLLMTHKRALALLPKYKDFYKILTPSPLAMERRQAVESHPNDYHPVAKYVHKMGLNGLRSVSNEEQMPFRSRLGRIARPVYNPHHILGLPLGENRHGLKLMGSSIPDSLMLFNPQYSWQTTASPEVTSTKKIAMFKSPDKKGSSNQPWPVVDPLDSGQEQQPQVDQNLPLGLVQELLKLNLNEFMAKVQGAAEGPKDASLPTPISQNSVFQITPPPSDSGYLTDALSKMDLKTFLERYRPDLWQQIVKNGVLPTLSQLGKMDKHRYADGTTNAKKITTKKKKKVKVTTPTTTSTTESTSTVASTTTRRRYTYRPKITVTTKPTFKATKSTTRRATPKTFKPVTLVSTKSKPTTTKSKSKATTTKKSM